MKVDFGPHGYPDFTADARVNVPLRVRDALHSDDEAMVRAGVLEAYPSWQFYDEEGAPIPHSADGIEMMPGDLARAMITEWLGAVVKDVEQRNLMKASLTSSRNGEAKASIPTTTPVS